MIGKKITKTILDRSAIVRWIPTLTWTALAASLLLSPSGSGTAVSWVSRLFGGSATTDAIGHVMINTILAFLWCWTISVYVSPTKAMRIILAGGIVWGIVAEFTQLFVPNRGASLFDLVANILGVLTGLITYRLLVAFAKSRNFHHMVNIHPRA